MIDKKTLLRQKSLKSRQTQHEAEVNSVAIETAVVTTEERQYRKQGRNLCRDKRRLCHDNKNC